MCVWIYLEGKPAAAGRWSDDDWPPPLLFCVFGCRVRILLKLRSDATKKDPRASPPTRLPLECCEIVLHRKEEKKLFKLLITRRARIVKAEWLEGSNEGGKNTAAGRPSPSETHKNAAALTIHNSLSPGACVYIIIHFPAGPPLHLSTLFIFLFFFAKLKRNLICYRS